MSEDPDFEMEVVEGDELNGPAGGESSPEMEEPDRTEVSRETGPEEREGASMLTAGANGNREWRRGPLEVLSNIIMGSSPKSKYYNESEEGPPFLQANNEFGYRSPTADRWCSNPAKRCEKGDLLMTIRGTYVGQMNLADDDYCIGRGLAAIAPGDDLNGEYLFHYLDHIESYVKSIAAGSTFDSVSSNDIESLEVRIPPLPEQRKIASVLYAVDQAIQKTEAIVEQKQILQEGLSKELLTGAVKNQSFRSMRVGPHKFQIPAHWEVVSITDACENLDSDRIPVKEAKREEMQGNIPYYGASGCIDYVDDYLFDEPLILLGEDGENLRSRTRRISFKITGKSWVNNHAHVLRPREEFDIDYLTDYFELLDYRPFVSGSAQPKLTQTMLNKISVPKPPLDEQREISSVLSGIKESVGREKYYRDRLQSLKKGLMQDLLTGEVRTADKAIEVLDEVAAHG